MGAGRAVEPAASTSATTSLLKGLWHAESFVTSTAVSVSRPGVEEMDNTTPPIDGPGPTELSWRNAIDSFTTHAFLVLDSGGVITSWSIGAERLFGYSADHMLGRHVACLFTPVDRELGVPTLALQRAERDGTVSSHRRFVHCDGTPRYVYTTLVGLRPDSALVGYAAIAYEAPIPAAEEDIHQLRDVLVARVEDASQRLSESNARLTTEIVDRTQAEAARMRLLRRLIVAQEDERRRIARDLHDDLGQRLTGLRLALEALEGSANDTALAGTFTDALEMLAHIDEGLDFLAWELRPAALDELGLIKVLDTYVEEWSRHAGVRALFHAPLQDVERFAAEIEVSVYRIAQEALHNVAKHARARSVNVLLETRGTHIVLVIEDDGIGFQGVGASEQMIGLTGMRERAAAVGGTLDIEATPGGGTTVLARIPIVLPARLGRAHDRRSGDQPGGASSSDGSTTVADGNGSVVTSMRARLQELQHAVASRDEFIATVAHELRNPVAPLMFQLRLAIEKAEHMAPSGEALPSEWVQSQLRRIEQRLHRLLETLDRLLDVSRLSTGRIDLQPEPMSLARVVRDVLGTFEAELGIARCTVLFTERQEASGSWDVLRIEQICRNLVSNAIRFGAGRPIDVVVDADPECATLEVRDRGVGIAPALHTRIFERFERGTEQRSGGFGIGLWVVKSICIAMGGTVAVESDLGEGACFTVRLPRRHERPFANSRSEEA
jgi:PAS domain S-box-containing protein